MRFESYAQYLEDMVLYCALKNVDFTDVAAGHDFLAV